MILYYVKNYFNLNIEWHLFEIANMTKPLIHAIHINNADVVAYARLRFICAAYARKQSHNPVLIRRTPCNITLDCKNNKYTRMT